jgi:hypothetical protein
LLPGAHHRFGRKDLARIGSEAGFDVPQFYFTDNGGIPAHPSMTWQTLSFGLLRGLRFSDNIIAMAKKPAWLLGLGAALFAVFACPRQAGNGCGFFLVVSLWGLSPESRHFPHSQPTNARSRALVI